MSNRKAVIHVAAFLAVALAATLPAAGESAGRYSMSPAEGGGFVRLDRETGQMASCQRRGEEWSCREMSEPGRGLDREIDRLREENTRLKAEIRQMEDIIFSEKREQSRAPEFRLPSEKDIDEAMSYAQRMLKKFRDKLKEFEGEDKATPL